jgi:hypothetical protein
MVANRHSSFVAWLTLCFIVLAFLAVVGSWIVGNPSAASAASSPDQVLKKDVPPPDAIEVAAARAVGLSDGFIGAGWPASRLVQDLYMRDLGLKTEFDRSDETAKLAIASAKKSVSSQADRRAWNVVSAMMWEVRMAPMYEHTALHRKYLANANVCFMAVRIAFGQDSASGDWKNAGSECVQNQATMKAEFDKK